MINKWIVLICFVTLATITFGCATTKVKQPAQKRTMSANLLKKLAEGHKPNNPHPIPQVVTKDNVDRGALIYERAKSQKTAVAPKVKSSRKADKPTVTIKKTSGSTSRSHDVSPTKHVSDKKFQKMYNQVQRNSAYMRETRDRTGTNRDLIRRIKPEYATTGLAGYSPGQIKLSIGQKRYLNTIAELIKGKKVSLDRIHGGADKIKVKGKNRDNVWYASQRGLKCFEYLNSKDAKLTDEVLDPIGETDQYGHNRRVQFDFTEHEIGILKKNGIR